MKASSSLLLAFVVAPVVPPQVWTTIDNRCIICHSDPSPDFGGLDMSKWADSPDGGVGFVHLGADGKQLPSKMTYREILDRISTDDLNEQMPLGGKLKPEELEPFKAWLESQIGK